MTSDYVPVLVLMAIGAIVVTVISLAAQLLGTRRPDAVKLAPYECGVADLDSVSKRTHIRYYLTALLFIIFDIEIAFLYPWAVVLRRFDSKLFAFGEMVVFLGVLSLAYAWVWKKGALEWD